MSKSTEIIRLNIDDLKISLLYEEIFTSFDRRRNVLYDEIKGNGFNPSCLLKIRKCPRRKGYEILCGVGRHMVLRQLAAEPKYSAAAFQEISCEVLEVGDADAVALIIEDNLNARRSLTGFSEVQLFLLARTLADLPNRTFNKDAIKNELNIAETTYQNLHFSLNYSIGRIRELYPEFAIELDTLSNENEATRMLRKIKLVNHAAEIGDWREFIEFFKGNSSISNFYKKVRHKDDQPVISNKEPEKKIPGLLQRAGAVISEIYEILRDLESGKIKNEKFASEDFIAHQENIKRFAELLDPETSAGLNRKITSKKSETLPTEQVQPGLFS